MIGQIIDLGSAPPCHIIMQSVALCQLSNHVLLCLDASPVKVGLRNVWICF